MSTAPISLQAFGEAITSLTSGNLFAKAAEIDNSLLHLVQSNEILAQEDDDECRLAVKENEELIKTLKKRLNLLQSEVEKRGLKWTEKESVNGEGDEGIHL
ncbi:hypothetical protein K470DRAFT_262629 [Piedraia hortae CBS 480.64]|uniref:Uncharacterized protein n=1 Tax=Piedraia hortae CBS 480.64 TaxID=1314780 RepID=A0A6A7C5H7_9PEZI|nr:hypothetical protein K470DRAFT_262629 [Piedraia hortae CBS 480.64]